MGILSQTFGDKLNNFQTASSSSSPIQVTTTSGKQYSLDGNQVNWIKSRYKQDGADTYGWDDADQYAKQTGQLSAKMRSTYKNSNVDRQLAEMGLPSEKNLEKYIADYQNWHTGGISDYFGKDVPQDFYTKTKDMFKGDWQYDDTQEDQLRKSSGQMPSKLASKYTDTEIDDELRAAGLPPVAEMGKYIGRYNNYSAIDNLYKNAAVAWANLGMTQDKNGQYIQNDNKVYTMEDGRQRKGKDLYAEAFYDEMRRKDKKGDYVYGNIFGMFKNNHLEDYDPDDYDGTNYNQYLGKEFVNASKVADLADDYAAYTAFSYDDFAGKYGDYYDQFLKGYKFSDGQTLEQKMANVQRANDEEAQKAYYDIEDKWFDGDVGIDSFIKRYQQDYPSNSYEQMFTDMYENGVSDKIVNKAMRAIRKSATQNTSQDGNSGYYDITNAYIRAKNKNDSAQNELWENINADPHDVEIAPSSSEPTNKRMTKDEYKGLDKEMWDYIDSSIKADEQDVATINTASDAIKNSLNMLFDADEGTVAEGDVDAVINLLNGIEKQNWNNPVAMRAALKEYGFNEDGTLSGTAAALTAGWSDENKRKLLRSIGNTVYSVETPDKDMEAALKAAGGNTELGSSKILHPDKKMDKEKFSYALEWAQEQIASGKLTEGDAYNILAGSGFQDELDEYMPEEWHRAVFEDFSVPALFEQTGGVQLAMWEEMTPEEQKKTASDMWNALSDEEKAAMYSDPNWWKSNPYIYRTFGQALEQQFSAVIPSLATDLAAGGVETVDAILANISGRPEMWGITQDLMDAEQFVNAYGSVYDNTNGAQIASIAADATAEIAKMFMLGSLGAEIGSAFETTEVGSLIAGAAGSTTPVVKQVAGLFLDSVKASPFMVSAFAHNYAKAKTMGATNGEATRFGVVTGLLEGFWEGCNFDKLWGRVIGGDKFAQMLVAGGEAFSESSVINMARVANMVVSGFSEWTEESLGYVGETLWETTSRWGKDKSEWSFEDYWEQASMGFLTGFIGAGISSGAINRESILYNYWSKNGKIASHIMDVAVAESIYNQATEAERDEWRNGDVHVMSQEDYAGLMVRLDTLNRQQDSEAAKAEYKDREDKANKKYNDVKAVENKLRAEAAALNPLDAEDAKKIGKLAPKVEEATRASSEAALVREDTIKKAAISMDERIEQENSEREKINRLVREHFAALYLQNESAIARRNEEEIRANVSRDRQNGAEVTPETRATAQESPANNVAQSEAKPATTENPEAAAREAAYDRVYTDQEAGKAYGNEAKNGKGRKLTRVEFAENERQNFQAKTTAKQGKVTLELAGLEAAEGMSDKEIIAEAKKAMTPDAAKKLDMFMKLSKALGMPMVIRDVVAGTSGYVHDGKLYVTLNGKQALLRVTAHEVTHWMKEHLPSGYDVLRTRLINDVGGQEAFDELVQKKAQEYDLDLSTEKGRLEADDEVCAELCEKMFENKDALEKFVNEAPEAAKTLKARLAKTLVAIKQAIKSLGTSNSETRGDLIKDQDTIELWYKTLSDAIDAANAEAKSKVQPTIEDVATETSTEAQPQAPPAPEGVEELGISAEEVRKQNLRSELKELAKKGTKVKDFDRASVNEILDRVIVGDRTNYSKADYAQIRGMLAQLIPEIKAMVDGDTSVDLDALNERVQTALNYMLDRYSEPSAELYDLREIIPGKIALTETAYNELRKNSQMTLREASNRMTRALGKFVNFVYKGSPNYSVASTIDEVWRDIGYDPNGQGNIAEDADALIKYVEERAERSSYDDLYKSQREDMVSAHAGEFLDAVQSAVDAKNARKAALHKIDDDYMALVKQYEDGDRKAERQLESDISEAAKINGYTTPMLFHGTPSFGWTTYKDSRHDTPFIYTSTKPEVAAHYAGDQNYAFRRDIGKKYDGGSSLDSIIEDARWVYGINLHTPTEQSKVERYASDIATATSIADRIDYLWNKLDYDMNRYPAEMDNAIHGMADIFYTIRDGDVAYGKKADEAARFLASDEAAQKELAENIAWSLRYLDRSREVFRNYYDEHRGEMSKDEKALFSYLMSYDVSDAAIDIQYGLDLLLNNDRVLQRADGGFVDADQMREGMDASHSIGAYKLYGDLGDNPFVFDANGGQFWALKVPEVSDGYTDTDAVCRWALENGYTSVVMKNIYDYGDKADNYVFFSPNQIKSADPVTYDDKGNVIPPSERFARSENDIRYSIDDDYMPLAELYEAGIASEEDIGQMQKDLDEAAYAEGYKLKGFHGTNATFTVFDPEKLGSKNFNAPSAYMGFFASKSRETAESYTGLSSMDFLSLQLNKDSSDKIEQIKEKYRFNEIEDEYNRARESFRSDYKRSHGYDEQVTNVVNELIRNARENNIFGNQDTMYAETLGSSLTRMLESDWDKANSNNMERAWEETDAYKDYMNLNGKILEEWEEYEIRRRGYEPQVKKLYIKMDNPLVHDFKGEERDVASFAARMAQAKKDGHDGCIFLNVRDGAEFDDIYAVFDNKQFKSADLVTYDDDGNIIPPSERFDQNKVDTRWTVDDDWDEAVRRYGAIEQGREPRARDVQVPRKSADNMRVSKFTRSVDESSKVTNAQAAEIRSEIGSEADRVKQLWSYIPKSNDETMKKAKEFIAARQPATAQREFHDMVVGGKYGTKTAAIGLQLLADASARDDWASVKEIAYDLRVLATEAGQSAQIFNVLKDLGGVGSAWYVEKLVNNLNTMYADEIQSGQMDPITVSEAAMNQVRAAKTQVEVDAAERLVADEIGPQLPLKLDEKLSNWRYLSMLGNPVTHIRNVTGNNLMHLMGGMKDVVASGVQRILEKTGVTDESERAHARLTSADKSYWDDFAQKSYDEQKRNLQGGGKLGFQSLVQQSKRSFDNKVLDTIARGKDPGTMSERKGLVGLLQNIRNNGAMGMLEVEDAWGLEKNYKRSFMEYMKAQGYSLNDEGKVGKVGKDGSFTEITNEQMNKAVEWATNQAWTNTFRGPSQLATELNKISKMNTASKLIVEGVMPFKKTPINIAKQGAMYSPAGIVIGTTELLTKVKQGKMSAATAIDHLSSGLTGTALMALGVVLAKAGILRGNGEDKKKYETYLQDTGDQTYSFKFGDASINMSAIAPATIPLFMGVALQEMLSRNGEDEGVDLSTITDVLAGTLNPFMEMSFMSSLNSALKNYNNDGIGGALGSTLMTAAQNYGSQYLPTLGGKVAQFIDPTVRSTKSDATSPVGGNLDYYARSLAKKVPGLEATLQPDVDVWGRTNTKDSFADWALDFANKFILPTNVKISNRDAVDKELIRVVESTGVTDFLPSDGNKYFTVKGVKYTMNAKQYAQYSQERGQAAYAAIKDVMASTAYVTASDEDKANMLNKAKEAAYKAVNNIWKEKLGAFNN